LHPSSRKNGHRTHQEITNELLPSLVVDHPTGFAPLDALVAAVTGLTGRGHRGEIYGVQKELEKVRISSGKMVIFSLKKESFW